ncbi:MAG: signal peptidase II [Microcella sp.]|nr:signal peptidase II [Microcella sp.]
MPSAETEPTNSPTTPEMIQPTRPVGRVLPFTLLWAASIIIIDQATKYWAEAVLVPYQAVPVIGEWIQWRLVYNPGAAFGIGGDFTWVLTLVAAIAVVGISIFVARISSVRWALAAGALLGGAISHLGDRLFRDPGFARGEIVDFIDYFGFFVGNVADIALVGGAIAIVLLSLIGVSPRRLEPHEPDPSLEAPSAETH